MIIIDVTRNDAKVTHTKKLTSGTKGQMCQFRFSEEWDDLSKIAVCVCGNIVKDAIVDDDNTIEIPWEVLSKHGKYLDIGVYGTDENGEKAIPTIYATVGAVCKGADPSGDESIEPTPTLWEQILSFLKNVPYTINEMGKAIFKGHAWSATADEKGNTIHEHYISKDDANNSFANAPKGAVSGDGAVRIDDASPLPHNIEVKADVDTTFKTYGKNLSGFKFGVSKWEQIEGTSRYVYYIGELPNATMTASIDITEIDGYLYLDKSTDGGNTYEHIYESGYAFVAGTGKLKSITFTKTENEKYRVWAGSKTATERVLNIQIELGSVATSIEEYKEPIEGTQLLYPCNTIIADVPDANIEITYNRDVNKVYTELKQAIINLGGTM